MCGSTGYELIPDGGNIMDRYSGGLLLGMLIMSGCMTDATVELTMAPFKATTALTNGTTEAINDILDPLTKFTSSTTPGEFADHHIRARQKTEVFAIYSYENLRADMARGSGEYLVSLATLAGIPSGRQTEFQGQMRDAYSTMFNETVPFRESTVRIVEAAWSEGFGRLEAERTEPRSSLIPSVEPRVKKMGRSTALISMQ
jgi:Protein of unknown function (DUF3015)